MFDFFNHPNDVKSIRGSLLQFIKEQLQKAEGGEGANIKSIFLYVNCKSDQRHLYDAALYTNEERRFKEEVQKIADDYAISLPPDWELEIAFRDDIPGEAAKAKYINAALLISSRKKSALKETRATVKVLHGETEQPSYGLSSALTGKITIGRDKQVQTAEGFYRENVIAFPSTSKNDSNRSVSRQHAHIEWDNDRGAFYLFADSGGVPPLNKIKVRSFNGQPVKLLTTEYGHLLKDGDQIILGESALLQFVEDQNHG